MCYLNMALLTETIPDDKQCQFETNYVGTVLILYQNPIQKNNEKAYVNVHCKIAIHPFYCFLHFYWLFEL